MNQSEVVHAGWVHRDRVNLSLLEAAQADTRDSVLLETELRSIKEGNSKGGTGPSSKERQKRSHKQQLSDAAQFANDIIELDGVLMDASSGHQPPPTSQSTKQKASRRQKRTSSRANITNSSTNPTSTTTASTNTSTNTNINTTPNVNNSTSFNFNTNRNSYNASNFFNIDTNTALNYNNNPNFSTNSNFSNNTNFSTNSYSFVRTNTGAWNSFQSGNHQPVVNPLQSACSQRVEVSGIPNAVGQHCPTSNSNQNLSLQNQFGRQVPNQNPRHVNYLGGWHSGLSPHPYELVILPNNVKKCYGCAAEFVQCHRLSPKNVVVKHIDRRLMRRDEHTGNFVYAPDFTNTYYHLNSEHIKRKNPLFDGRVNVTIEIYQSLDTAQISFVTLSGPQVVIT